MVDGPLEYGGFTRVQSCRKQKKIRSRNKMFVTFIVAGTCLEILRRLRRASAQQLLISAFFLSYSMG